MFNFKTSNILSIWDSDDDEKSKIQMKWYKGCEWEDCFVHSGLNTAPADKVFLFLARAHTHTTEPLAVLTVGCCGDKKFFSFGATWVLIRTKESARSGAIIILTRPLMNRNHAIQTEAPLSITHRINLFSISIGHAILSHFQQTPRSRWCVGLISATACDVLLY